jgi:polyketide cyclase/dehydrase/lipid transport protein
MVWIILGCIAGIIILFLLYVASKPNDFRIERSATMAAPPATVFAQVNDFHNWQAWSPWAKLDPNMTQTYEGPDAGRGAVYSWTGNNKVGAGRMAITESRPNEYILILLEFLRPFKSTNKAEFSFRPTGSQTEVNWVMTGQHNFMSKLFCSFMSMDKMVGKDFEKGLSQMKAVAESPK